MAELDGQDWWFRCRFAGSGRPARPTGGCWSSGGSPPSPTCGSNGHAPPARSESMFASHRVAVAERSAGRPRAVHPLRRPRPRCSGSAGPGPGGGPRCLSSQNLRWIRTTLLGRQAGWAVTPGPGRAVAARRPSVRPAPSRWSTSRVLAACAPGPDRRRPGRVAVTLAVDAVRRWPRPGGSDRRGRGGGATDTAGAADRSTRGGRGVGRARCALDAVERWWPHTHGDQPLLPGGGRGRRRRCRPRATSASGPSRSTGPTSGFAWPSTGRRCSAGAPAGTRSTRWPPRRPTTTSLPPCRLARAAA